MKKKVLTSVVSVVFLLFSNGGFADRGTELKKLYPKEYEILGPTLFNELIKSLEKTTDPPPQCRGRLTLSSNTPVPTADVTSATTVYFTPYSGNYLTLYNGSRWQLHNFGELSVAVPATTNTPFDIFAYLNGDTVALETTDWTNDTTRATALTTLNGIYVKSGATTRRYLGTGRTTGNSGETEDSTSSRLLWNQCNRVPRTLKALTGGQWSYATATWRGVNGDSTLGVSRVAYVVGLSREVASNEIFIPHCLNNSDVNVAVGVGVNSTSANSADLYGAFAVNYGFRNTLFAAYNGFTSVGYSYLQLLEISDAAGSSDFYTAYSSGGNIYYGGMLGEIWN